MTNEFLDQTDSLNTTEDGPARGSGGEDTGGPGDGAGAGSEGGDAARKKKRRGKRGGRGRKKAGSAAGAAGEPVSETGDAAESDAGVVSAVQDPADEAEGGADAPEPASEVPAKGPVKKKRSRARSARSEAAEAVEAAALEEADGADAGRGDQGRDAEDAEAGRDEDDVEGSERGGGPGGLRGVVAVREPARISGPRLVGPKLVSKVAGVKTGKAVVKEEAARRVDMVVNYVPGEECRIAVVEDGQLEEFYSEPTGQVSRVGNIYVGRVTNIETAIQAAFVDFGLEESGFLHVSDLHPKYFRDEDEGTEELGKKTPRKQRPPIQACLRKGQEIIVQVLKEGVGTKGPSLTSYLSIPGRFLVMMPDMEKFGVSRKEEDDDKRREAKEILSQLELPDGFGFILRTAGFGRTKTELKRDLAYLQRLWKDMEARRGKGSKPRLLYSESDLLIRSLRDLLGNDVQRVIVDDEHAVARAARFMKIVAPRTQAQLVHYKGALPIYHAFDVERQVQQIHAREVPLPSGGRLIIEQTEALVAIDVNSGKSRGAKDAETNAYQTNIEAVDSICRQLRLRDLGGLVINDLIDMRLVSHRKDIENRFRERLKRDRARTTTLQISEFGILEMTRQRMRGSQESQHFSECPICRGRGIVQKADSVAADALRDLAALLDHDRVHRVELAVHPRIAGALLTTRRSSLTRAELSSGKRIDVRVSDAVPPDRVALYAYDVNNADIDLDRLPRGRGKQVLEVVDLGVPSRGREEADEAWAVDAQAEAAEASRKRLSEQLAAAKSAAAPAEDDLPDLSDLDEDDDDRPLGAAGRPGSEEDAAGEGGKRKRRRRRRRGKGSGEGAEGEGGAGPRDERAETSQPDDEGGEPRGDGADDVPMDDSDEGDDDADGGEVVLGPDGLPLKKKRRRRRGGRRRRKNREGGEGGTEGGRGPETADRTTTPVPGPSRDPSSGSSRGPSGGASGGAGAGRSSGQAVGRPGGSSVRREEGAAARGVPGSGPSAGGEVSRNGVGGSAEEPAKPARRALYGAGRRKLAPSEVSKIKGKKDGR